MYCYTDSYKYRGARRAACKSDMIGVRLCGLGGGRWTPDAGPRRGGEKPGGERATHQGDGTRQEAGVEGKVSVLTHPAPTPLTNFNNFPMDVMHGH